ncbi:MAG: helix-turn-helix domain-containing protein [Treponema sp.]|nr:helix-turn-helix domain-containing protein [Treponema sp.]
MTPTEKHKEEQDELKTLRMNRILDASFELFAERGIDTIAMTDIAKKAEIGVASLYRYFETKEDLAIEVAIHAWKKEEKIFHQVYSSSDYDSKTGFEQLRVLLNIFTTAIDSQTKFFRFIYFFDGFVKKENVDIERLSKYESIITNVNLIVLNALEKGVSDGSINYQKSENNHISNASIKEMHFTIMHALFSMAQKMALSGEMLYMDREVSASTQLELMGNLILASIR